jgi:hypothetical protein
MLTLVLDRMFILDKIDLQHQNILKNIENLMLMSLVKYKNIGELQMMKLNSRLHIAMEKAHINLSTLNLLLKLID